MAMVLTERRGAVAVITLNNPAQYNALGGTLIAELNAAFDAGLADKAVRAIVLTGAGKGFCAGAQLGGSTFDAGDRVASLLRDEVNPLIAKMRAAAVPVVVAVNGPAAGAGVGIALAGDIVLAARSARFVLSFVKLGAALDAGTSQLLQRSVGVARARALALLGEPLDAARAEQWGLIWKTVDDEQLMSEAFALAQKLAEGPPISIGLIKGQVEAAFAAPLATALDGEAIAQAKAFVTEDLREGAAAFVEKRPAKFSGR
ncbi:enoyl-CoA hydratase/isomerase family protein [Bradyrhizobium sp. U87765 SZCCT0131]|uniref:enoyl-CoA hydratase-related protein n=1 Tax=unclassified Bradyrhizobium TaxID=2631580 RepID=UPI001BA7327F|nr:MULTISPECIES: enoyl-CoA hydratase-related protein [unclassified Bradyrhizobium]MBR1217655.1 enoyl-CoA hydratase/isomerase family protein [Bradyrhizobium sp. U87765 SZCCT0131]MBR1261399.1 enoyl-CoA hydratase/isomerase family protein [Bradyrhizobium sp. U87765 SZCCT0134]MBR1303153.1 enoyl-CoA hydratase/isomerase family protein [Bradyrhizobium sp. U87765 SZCCT0110]MBR1318759.1 enoyl-CoA hydratase/isomerase family protein [Bradyrhizobium sp. U87765 SZCCT0109]MBR1347084.1 enoyl-CoA hydratase/iso